MKQQTYPKCPCCGQKITPHYNGFINRLETEPYIMPTGNMGFHRIDIWLVNISNKSLSIIPTKSGEPKVPDDIKPFLPDGAIEKCREHNKELLNKFPTDSWFWSHGI